MSARIQAWRIACRAPDCHPFHVAAEVLERGGDDDAFTIGLLHDALEEGYASEDEILQHFSVSVYNAIWALTRQDGETYRAYIGRVADEGGAAREVKLADLTVNLRRCQLDGNKSLTLRYLRAFHALDKGAESLWRVEAEQGRLDDRKRAS